MATTVATQDLDLGARAREILNRHPAVGLAVAIVNPGGLESFHGEGLADIASGASVTETTIFRIASVTKTFTAIAVMQLSEQGLLDLDTPADEYLRAYRLVPARPDFRPATVRHLLTHTAGIRESRRLTDVLRWRDLGETVRAGRPVPTPAQFYEGRLRVDADPGTRFMYTDHGFATLGQIVEDVTRRPLHRQLAERIFEPLGMSDTSLLRGGLDRSRLAMPYELRARGPQAVDDYELVTYAGGGVSSTARDMARYLSALLRNDGTLLEPATLRMMFAPQYQPDPRIPGVGLSFFRSDLHGHLGLEHDGVLPGFDSSVYLAPDDGVAVMAFANGARRGMHWLVPETAALVRRLIGVPDDRVRTDVPHHPEVWPEICGRYRFAATLTDPAKLTLGPGVEVLIRGGRPLIRASSPLPALRRGFVLHPDDPDDPYVFRIEFPWFGIGTCRVVFTRRPGEGVTALHTDAGPVSFERRR